MANLEMIEYPYYFGPGWYSVETNPKGYKFKWMSHEAYIIYHTNISTSLSLVFENPHPINKEFRIYDSNNNVLSSGTLQHKQSSSININLSYGSSFIKIVCNGIVPKHNNRLLSLLLRVIFVNNQEISVDRMHTRGLTRSESTGLRSITDLINNNLLTHPKNKLETIGLLTTNKEIEDGTTQKFINQLIYTTSKTEAKNINFDFIINNTKLVDSIYKNYQPIIKKIFKNFSVVSCDLSAEEDIYIRNYNQDIEIPTYGYASGPNLMFFKTISLYKKYNTVLLMETDSFLKKHWLSKLNSFVESSNGFLVSGALYDGDIKCQKKNCQLATHINGGTALYATGHNVLQELIKYLETYLIHCVSQGNKNITYDYLLKILIDDHLYDNYSSDIEHKIWKFIHRYYLFNNLIGNYSTENIIAPIEDIEKIHNFYILHKKGVCNV